MLDIQHLRSHLDEVANQLAKRGYTFPVAEFNTLEAERKKIQTHTEALQAKRNATSKQIGQAKSKG